MSLQRSELVSWEGKIFIGLPILILRTFYYKPMMGERGPNIAIFVVGSVSYVSAESLEREGSLSSCSFYEKLADYYSHVFSLVHPVIEFSFKEMKMWDQFKISSCCLCVWRKSREIMGRGSPRFPTPIKESFSADLLPATKSYWTGWPLELCMLVWLNPRARREHLRSLLS